MPALADGKYAQAGTFPTVPRSAHRRHPATKALPASGGGILVAGVNGPRAKVSRRTWPRGLRIIYWLSVSGLVVGIAQIFFWSMTYPKFFRHLTFQGIYAALAFALGLACVIIGALGHRRAFAHTVLFVTGFHLSALGYISFQFWAPVLPGVVSGRVDIFEEWEKNAPTHCWNSLAVLAHILVGYYLLRFEFDWFRSRAR